MLRSRLLSALLLLPIVTLLVYLGGIPWLLLILLAGALGWFEMTRLLQRDHFAIDRLLGLFFVVGAIIEAFVQSHAWVAFDLLRPLLTVFLILSLIWALYDQTEHPTADWAMNVAGAVYLGFLLGHFVALRERPNGLMWIALAIGLTWLADTMAYFVGRGLGKHPLWPRISPKKTWEGLAGGTAAALIGGPLLGMWLVGLAPWLGFLLGALVAVTSVFGDLAVSLFKRMAKMKDSSQLIPGHGGILDRLDSLMFTIPVATHFAWVVAGK